MLVVKQGEVAVIKAYVGLPTQDTSGAAFKFGSIVRPGHRGIWQEPLRTGKYAINPRCYEAENVPTAILSLNWSEAVVRGPQARRAAVADRSQEPRRLRLPDRTGRADPRARHHAPRASSAWSARCQPGQRGAAGGRRQPLPRQAAEHAGGAVHRDPPAGAAAALEHIRAQLNQYEVETRGVYIQDVIFPPELVQVLTQREIANQEKATYQKQQEAQTSRIDMEKAKGTADMQAQLARPRSACEIKAERGRAREARGARARRPTCELTGEAEAREDPGDRPRRGEGDRGARSRARRPGSRRRPRRSGRAATAWSRSPTRWPRATSRWCPRCSSPAAAVRSRGSPRR